MKNLAVLFAITFALLSQPGDAFSLKKFGKHLGQGVAITAGACVLLIALDRANNSGYYVPQNYNPYPMACGGNQPTQLYVSGGNSYYPGVTSPMSINGTIGGQLHQYTVWPGQTFGSYTGPSTITGY
jgi:hypothetical protein